MGLIDFLLNDANHVYKSIPQRYNKSLRLRFLAIECKMYRDRDYLPTNLPVNNLSTRNQ